MKKKKVIIIISIILVILIITGIVIGICLKNKNEENSEEKDETGSKWGDTYYAYIKEALEEDDKAEAEEKYGIIQGMEDAKLQFCEIEENQDPAMIMTYKKNNSSYVNVYQKTDDGKVTYIAYKQPTDIEYLYNIEKDDYSWYIHANNENSETYSLLKNIVNKLKENSSKSEENANVNIAELKADYTIKQDEKEETWETESGEKVTLSKFDEIFVKPEIEENSKIEFNSEIKEKDLQEEFKKAVEKHQKEMLKITDEVIARVTKKMEETKIKKEKIEKAKEEAKKGLKVGKYTLKYGKYVGYVDDYRLDDVLVLNSDGTCSLTANWYGEGVKARNFKYKVGTYNFAQGVEPDYKTGIALFNEDGTIASQYIPTSNTALSDGDLVLLKFEGEGTIAKPTPAPTPTPKPQNNQSSKGQLTAFEYDTSANNPVPVGTYYRGKGSGAESVLEIKNATGNSFDFSINAIYMTSAGYPNIGEISGTAKAIKGGNYVATFHEDGQYGFDYNMFFKIAGGNSNTGIMIEDECYMYSFGKTEIPPYAGHNVTFEGSYSK